MFRYFIIMVRYYFTNAQKSRDIFIVREKFNSN